MEKLSFFIVDFEGFMKFYYVNDGPFKISMEIHFVSLFFLNKRNITTSLLMIHLKCTAVHYPQAP